MKKLLILAIALYSFGIMYDSNGTPPPVFEQFKGGCFTHAKAKIDSTIQQRDSAHMAFSGQHGRPTDPKIKEVCREIYYYSFPLSQKSMKFILITFQQKALLTKSC